MLSDVSLELQQALGLTFIDKLSFHLTCSKSLILFDASLEITLTLGLTIIDKQPKP